VHRIKADVRRDEITRAGGHGVENKATGFVGERGEPKLRQLELGADEEIAGGGVADGSGDDAGVGGASDGGRRENKATAQASALENERENRVFGCMVGAQCWRDLRPSTAWVVGPTSVMPRSSIAKLIS